MPDQARVIKYSELVSILKSKDPRQFEQNSWIWDGTFHFLDKSEKLGTGGHCNHI